MMDIQEDKDFAALPEIAKLYQVCKERDLTIAEREYLKGARYAWQATKAQAVPEGLILAKDKPVAYMVQNKFWKGEFEVRLLSEMPKPEFEGDSYDVEIPLYSIEALDQSHE